MIPRKHCVGLLDADKESLASIMDAVKRLGLAYEKKIGSTGFNLMAASGTDAQQSVPHLHFHLMPRFKDDGLDTWPTLPKFACNPDEMYSLLKISE
ncbi:HIT domain-containing protein [Bdellovibrionota bacterium FG-2]